MPVEIEAVLALLPELFPGIQKIPLANIRPNPQNPGAALSDPDIQDMADNLAERGLVNPIKVRPDKAGPLARGPQAEGQALGVPGQGAEPQNGPGPLVEGVKPHPENPRLTAEGRPWVLEDFRFMILAGERRYRAAGRLGWGTILANILVPTEEEAVEITHLDNDVRDRGWWAGYQSIEQLIQANPNLTQRQVGAKLKMDREKVSRAIRLLPLLNPEARGLIGRSATNSNKGIRGISDRAAARLADLGPGTGLKPGVKKAGEETQKLWPYPAIPVESLDLVRRALEVAIDQEMTEAGVKALVKWVKDGGQPEKYGQTQKQSTPSGEKALSGTEVAASSTPAYSAGTPRNDSRNYDMVQGSRNDSQNEEDEEDEEDFKPIPWSEASKHWDYLNIPLSRVRMQPTLAEVYGRSRDMERRAQAMQKIRYTGNLKVRRLSVAEKETDPDHDYELFDDFQTFQSAQWLGWESLPAQVYDIDQWEAVRLHNHLASVTFPWTWIEIYGAMERAAEDGSGGTVAEAANIYLEDPAKAEGLFPVLRLLNKSTRDAICLSVRKRFKGRYDQGGHRFRPEFALLLKPLEGAAINLFETQKLVERVVKVAIENELYSEDLQELVGWVLEGNKPEEFYEKEAAVE